MLVNEAMTSIKPSEQFGESIFNLDDDEAPFDAPTSNNLISLSNLQSFSEFNDPNSAYMAIRELKNESHDSIKLPDSIYPKCSIKLTFTSTIAYKNYQIIKNLFLLIFKVVYPEEFFRRMYEKTYFTILGMDKGTKEIISIAVIDVKQDKKSADILALGVVKEYRNKKLGSILLKKVLEELTVMGISESKLIVQCVNESAIRLYQNFGFFIDKTLEDYYNFENSIENKAYLMKKTLISKKFWVFDVFRRITDKIFLRDRERGGIEIIGKNSK